MGQDMRLFKVGFRRHGVAQHADEKKGNKKKKIDLALMGEDMRLFKVVFRRHGVAQHADAVGEQEVALFIYVWKVCVPPQLVPVCVCVCVRLCDTHPHPSSVSRSHTHTHSLSLTHTDKHARTHTVRTRRQLGPPSSISS